MKGPVRVRLAFDIWLTPTPRDENIREAIRAIAEIEERAERRVGAEARRAVSSACATVVRRMEAAGVKIEPTR